MRARTPGPWARWRHRVSGRLAVRKTMTRLSDGRELIYFDTGPVAGRDHPDRRRLPTARPQSELRRDPLTGAWVMYAGHRQDRMHLPDAADCPLCPTTPDRPTEIPAPDYEVVVFENRYPALTAAAPGTPAPQARRDPGELLRARPPAGRCEVVCFTSDHDATFAGLTPERARLVIEALADRTRELGRLPEVEQVYCFENRGREIGVTQAHPHGQVYGYPFITPRTDSMLAAARAHARRTGRNLFDDVLAAERADGSRVVASGQHWTAFVPHAARWPYEVHCYPHRRVPDLASLRADERQELADVQLDLLGRFARLFAEPAPYIAAWHQAPVRAGRRLFALHWELFTTRRGSNKLKYLAGSESGMDAFASDVIPERAAEQLRKLA
jgi:UDPglucose--hexose-1-phosphate uridylyltransferase